MLATLKDSFKTYLLIFWPPPPTSPTPPFFSLQWIQNNDNNSVTAAVYYTDLTLGDLKIIILSQYSMFIWQVERHIYIM